MISTLESHDPSTPAIISCAEDRVLSYEQLLSAVDENRRILATVPRPALALLSCGNTVGSIAAYLGCLAADVPVCLLEPNEKALSALIRRYQPSIVILPLGAAPPAGYRDSLPLAGGRYVACIHPDRAPFGNGIHPSLALLLTTSGSTGNAKLVRLSRGNLNANARSITTYLGLGPGERSIQSLPMHYAYGLSLVNSHLYAGGTVVLTTWSFMRREFWSDCDRTGCTSFAGVPYMYELLHRLRLSPAVRPTLTTLTQAGGSLRPDLIEQYHRSTKRYRKRFFTMYGQTEATARISYVPPDRLGEKIGAIGIPVPEGRLGTAPVGEDGELQQLVYEGPNVMLGYASCPQDLSLGDVQQGRLPTGDLARVDDDGFFYVSGRLIRIAKMYGKRVNLIDVEDEIEGSFPCRVAATERADRLHLFVQSYGDLELADVRTRVARFVSLMPAAVRVEAIDGIPTTASGKKDYRALEASSCGSPADASIQRL